MYKFFKNSVRKYTLTALAVLFIAGLFCTPLQAAYVQPASDIMAADETADNEIRSGISLTRENGQSTATFLDRNRSSFQALSASETLTIESEEPFASVYVVWDAQPAVWHLTAQNITSEGGRNGFLHELIHLHKPSTSAVMRLGEANYKLCDLYLFAEGELPTWVQQWQPPLEEADLLAIPTHADDEHLFFGGILPTYAGERGLRVQVAYMTNHWGERYRPHELLDGLWTVGVTAYPIMGPFDDLYASKESLASAEACFVHEEVLKWQVEMMRRFKPQVVVGHDLAGEYGHGAHILNATTLLEALPLCSDASVFPESAAAYGTWEVPKAYLHLYAENQIVMDWNIPLEHFDGATAFEVAEAGFAKHVSQTSYFSVQQGGTWEDCRKFGLAHTRVGADVAKNDLFENIDLTPEEPAVVSSAPAVSSEPEIATTEEPPVSSVAEDESAISLPSEEGGSGVTPEQTRIFAIVLSIICGVGGAVLLIVGAVQKVKIKKEKQQENDD